MPRRLVFIRHVSSPHSRGVSDYDRPIDEEGRTNSERMARHLNDDEWLPRRVLCSAAKRAAETWEAMSSQVDADFEVTFTDMLYSADIEDICEQIWGLSPDRRQALLIGHNPGWSDAVSWLTGVRTKMPKGSAALLEVPDAEWSEAVQKRKCELIELVRPFELRAD
ncbi:MAG: histidine phosphatase family protein [Bradymonadaceae bacterium]